MTYTTVGKPHQPAELAEAGELRARRVETIVVDDVDQCLTDKLAEHLRRILREASQAAQKIIVSVTSDVGAVRSTSGNILRNPVLMHVSVFCKSPRKTQHWTCIASALLKNDIVR